MIKLNQIINADCMDIMKDIPDKYFELAIVDPPYGLDIPNMNMGAGKGKRSSNINNRQWSKNDWDKEKPNQKYFDELFRVSQNQIIWGGNYFQLYFDTHTIIWDKEIPLGLSFSDFEMAWTSFTGSNKFFRYSVYLDNKNKTHPTQKPVALYKWLLKNYAKPNDKILDTHSGSGTTAIACIDMNFEYLCIEKDKDYYDASLKRIDKELLKIKMF